MINQKLKVTFAKRGLMKFISHLDLMRLFQRASRRAALPVALTEGFNPHLRMSIEPALKLGREADALTAVFKIDGWMKAEEFRERLQGQLPEGIELSKAEVI